MKTTLDLPDELILAVRAKAADEHRLLDQVVADLLERGLSRVDRRSGTSGGRIQLPLVNCVHEARPEDEMTPERVADILLEDEATRHRDPLR